ncbi:MAG: hypothetical protein HGA67_01445 [Candidatus Yonathbacteria bacterium]|nr:hypothetical protein [Candidatus Yonathbacteria bacterium]
MFSNETIERQYTISPDIPHVACMNCGAVMVASMKGVTPLLSVILPVAGYEEVEVSIKVPFKQERMHTRAYNGFVTECPFCSLQYLQYEGHTRRD